VDTQGLVLAAKVHRANVTDRDGIKLLLEPAASTSFPRLPHLWLDAGYTGQDRGAGWLYLCGDEPPYGEEIGSRMRVFRQFRGEVRRTFLPRIPVHSSLGPSNTERHGPPEHEALTAEFMSIEPAARSSRNARTIRSPRAA
jgi:hypothetical protein